jgi:endonuclease/exonuclease/phosphatase family metal-dependent hydrolase
MISSIYNSTILAMKRLGRSFALPVRVYAREGEAPAEPRLSRWGLLIAACIMAALSGATPAHAEDDTLTVITYNVQFLPGIAAAANKRKEPDYRAQRIAEEVSQFDIVALQEVFHDTHRQQIVDAVREAWDGDGVEFVSPKPADRFNGGCMLMTRLPVLETNAVVFENYSTPEEYGLRADGHAAKGVIHARLARDAGDPDTFIDVYVTHLEARADHLRPAQYKEMEAFIQKTTHPTAPALFLGDFNTRGMAEHRADPESQYTQLMQSLNAAKPGTLDLWPELKGDALGGTSEQESADLGKRIDYIFYAPGDNAPEPVDIRVELYQDPRVEALSDHNAVIAQFDWPRKR